MNRVIYYINKKDFTEIILILCFKYVVHVIEILFAKIVIFLIITAHHVSLLIVLTNIWKILFAKIVVILRISFLLIYSLIYFAWLFVLQIYGVKL